MGFNSGFKGLNIAEAVIATLAVRAEQQHIIQVSITCDVEGGLELCCKHANAMEVIVPNFRVMNIAHFTYFVMTQIGQDLSTKSIEYVTFQVL